MAGGPGSYHLKSWLVETSVDGKVWREVDHLENNDQLNSVWFTPMFAITGGEICRFTRLVNISKNHYGYPVRRPRRPRGKSIKNTLLIHLTFSVENCCEQGEILSKIYKSSVQKSRF
jgi:hypothetical protein